MSIPTSSDDAAADNRLARLVATLTERLRSGDFPDLEAEVRLNPEIAADLRALWPAILLAEAAARPESDLVTLSEAAQAHRASADATPLPRTLGDYLLEAELGRGGMGVVYRAKQLSLQRTVAVKLMLRGELASLDDFTRFRIEAEAAAKLDHPHIVPVFQIGEWDGRPYFSMKYIAGETLAQRVAAGPLPGRDAAALLVPVARAVHHAHQLGILHRDLKPSNVLIDEEGKPHVTDFGLAKRVDAGASGATGVTQTGAILGTPNYMPPEQAAGSRGTLGPAGDVYSIGAILYHLLTGRPPFQSANPVDTLMLVMEQEPVPPRMLNPKVDRELEMICLKCLQKPPDLRYASAAELAADLEAFLQGEPVSAGSWSLFSFVDRMLRPTHHAAVLENWGLLWMWHSLLVLVLCGVTAAMVWLGIENHAWYLTLWSVGLIVWGTIFWQLRRRAGPVTFVERQIAHVWGGAVIGTICVFLIEVLLQRQYPDIRVLSLCPVLAVMAGMVFLIKAGTLSGSFYFASLAFFLIAIVMALQPSRAVGVLLFGGMSAACFFLPGLVYYRQRIGKE